MPQWSEARPKVSERCRFTKRYQESLRAQFPELVEMHGIVRLLYLDRHEVHIRLDGFPGELFMTLLTNLVREDYDGPDPLDETVIHVSELRVWNGDEG